MPDNERERERERLKLIPTVPSLGIELKSFHKTVQIETIGKLCILMKQRETLTA